MKVVLINKSDSTGGAAVVTMRLMTALRELGVDARMLVVEKRTSSPYVECVASPTRCKIPFVEERLKVYIANGFNRADLFKVDPASDGLPLWRHPLVKEADVICLNWVNQGFLSLHGLEKIRRLGKPVVWTMHDMWNFTGICHHAGTCLRWGAECGDCPLLGARKGPRDMSHRVWQRKATAYGPQSNAAGPIHFVAVSNWLARLASQSSLLGDQPVSVIPNAFPIPDAVTPATPHEGFEFVMGAARLDDPVKGFPILIQATEELRRRHPELAERSRLTTFGNIRNPEAFDRLAIPHRHLGMLAGEENIRRVYAEADAIVSTSLYETLPGTLVEGLAYGAVPVSFSRGGQSDIVDHLSTGYLAEWNDDPHLGARNIADGLAWAAENAGEAIRKKMFGSARQRFDAPAVAERYVRLFRSLLFEGSGNRR